MEERVSVRFSLEAQRAVEEIMRLGRYGTFEDAVKRAISDELFLQRQLSGGAIILVKDGSGYKELVWP